MPIYNTSDNHQTEYVWKSRREIRGDAYEANDRMVELVIADAAKYPDEKSALIIEGDFYDSMNISGETSERTRKQLDMLHVAGIAVYYVQGNHDKGTVPHTSTHPNVFNLNESLVQIGERVVYGLKWRPSTEYKQAILAAPPCDLLAIHAKSQHLAGGFQSESNIFMDTDIPEHVKNVVCGDIHVVDRQPFQDGRGYYLSPGSTHPCDLSQGGKHGVWKMSATGPVTWEFLEIQTRQIYRMEIQCDTSLEGVRNFLTNLGDPMKALVELLYMSEYGPDVAALRDEFADKAFFWLKPSKIGKTVTNAKYEELKSSAVDMDMAHHAQHIVDPAKDPEAYNLRILALDEDQETLKEQLAKVWEAL